jgi:ATP-dependent Lhr-like helicase
MITQTNTPFTDEESLSKLNVYVRKWFTGRFTELTPPQKYTFKLITEKTNTLVTAPTGSGKTLSGFLSIISALFDYSLNGKLEDKVYCLYVSPLRALNNDVHRNLMVPLDEIYQMITKEKGLEMLKSNIKQVTIGVRTGDTTQQERHKQLIKPPNILVTTPESLAIMINSDKFVENLKSVEYLIIDEIHELANNKRGVHLSLSVARLQEIIGHDMAKVGLGATLYPLEEAARFLVGYKEGKEADCTIVDASWSKVLDVKTISPVADMVYTPDEKVEDEMYKKIDAIIKSSKSTLIFTNTRSGTERVVFNLKSRFKYSDEDVAAHHGSLSRESRLEVEEMLKKGSLKCAVSSTSLELGVDIGAIENVVQLGSPKSVTRAIQRIGRSGHSFRSVAKGEIMVLNRDDLVECTIMLDSVLKKHLDSFVVPKNALDVLAQHIIGMSLNRKWNIDEAYDLVRRAYAYHDLGKDDFMSLVNYLAGNYVGLESRRVYGKIWYDEKEQAFGKRGMLAKVIYMLNLGTIPDEVAINVYVAKKWIGNIEEEFLTKLKKDDVFALGGKLYKFEYSRGMSCYVSDAKSSVPTIPPWFSEQLPLSFELAEHIGEFRAQFSSILRDYIKRKKVKHISKTDELPKEIDEYLSALPIDENSKMALFGYFMEQLLFAKEVPNNKLMLIELTSEPSSELNYAVFHSMFGRRVNDALSRALAVEMADIYDTDIGVMVNDNGFVLTSEEDINITERAFKDMISDITSIGLSTMLKSNIRRTELMKRKFRHVAARSFMILRNYKGYKIPVGRQQVNAQVLLKASEEIDPNFPVIKETYREILNDTMDLPRAEGIISGLGSGATKFKIIKTQTPSPFSHNMLTFGSADVILMRERHKHLQALHRMVMEKIGEKT